MTTSSTNSANSLPTDTPVLILIAATITVINKSGHHVIASHHIDPDHNYWPNKQKNPGKSRGNL